MDRTPPSQAWSGFSLCLAFVPTAQGRHGRRGRKPCSSVRPGPAECPIFPRTLIFPQLCHSFLLILSTAVKLSTLPTLTGHPELKAWPYNKTLCLGFLKGKRIMTVTAHNKRRVKGPPHKLILVKCLEEGLAHQSMT